MCHLDCREATSLNATQRSWLHPPYDISNSLSRLPLGFKARRAWKSVCGGGVGGWGGAGTGWLGVLTHLPDGAIFFPCPLQGMSVLATHYDGSGALCYCGCWIVLWGGSRGEGGQGARTLLCLARGGWGGGGGASCGAGGVCMSVSQLPAPSPTHLVPSARVHTRPACSPIQHPQPVRPQRVPGHHCRSGGGDGAPPLCAEPQLHHWSGRLRRPLDRRQHRWVLMISQVWRGGVFGGWRWRMGGGRRVRCGCQRQPLDRRQRR